jgi:hypothetical protein
MRGLLTAAGGVFPLRLPDPVFVLCTEGSRVLSEGVVSEAAGLTEANTALHEAGRVLNPGG